MPPKTTAEVRLLFRDDHVRLTLKLRGKIVEEEVFAADAPKQTVDEVARCLFDDGFDLVNYTLYGIEQ